MKGRRKGQRIGPLYGAVEKQKGYGAWCYNARLGRNLTIDELAARAEVSRRTILRIETGVHRPTYRTRQRLQRALCLIPPAS